MQISNIFKSIGFLGQIFENSLNSEQQIETLAILPSIKNPRWLVPIKNKKLFISSLSLYQPSLKRAKLLKKLTVLMAKSGLSNLAIRNRVYFQRNDDSIKAMFKRDDLHYAFFTGTKGCHRKVTVQVMDEEGIILGYIKVSDNEDVDKLLKNEAEILGDLSRLEIRTGLFPKVIYHGHIDDVNILALDSLKSINSKFSNSLSDSHINFMSEIFLKTSKTMIFKESGFAKELRKRLGDLETQRLEDLEIKRLKKPEIVKLKDFYKEIFNYVDEKMGKDTLPFGICHRDFAPWNTFFNNDKLYVFDWEYSKMGYPPMLDIFHFILQDGILVRHLKPDGLLKRVLKNGKWLSKYSRLVGIKESLIMPLLLCYLLDISLLYIEREKGNIIPTTTITLNIWKEIMNLVIGYR